MATDYKLYYATNRNHIGSDRWKPNSYGTKFSDDGMENLHFGVINVSANEEEVDNYLNMQVENCGIGDGIELSKYFSKCAEKASLIVTFKENLSTDIAEKAQSDAKLGSQGMFNAVMQDMENSSDVLVYIHGFNVSWLDAVGAALSLQCMLRKNQKDPTQEIQVILFTWPSDGLALPWVSYKSDRSEATGSGAAVGRALLKVRDFLADLRDLAKKGGRQLCGQDIHLLCHSMGNFLLQSALQRVTDHTPGNTLPRIFEHVFLCAPDVDDTALEPGQPLERINQITRNVSIYHNQHDKAMVVSDYTKGNPERLGGTGTARPSMLHNKVHQIDCAPIAPGLIQHSYYLIGTINADIRASMDGWMETK